MLMTAYRSIFIQGLFKQDNKVFADDFLKYMYLHFLLSLKKCSTLFAFSEKMLELVVQVRLQIQASRLGYMGESSKFPKS